MSFRPPMFPRRFWAATVSALLVATGLFVVVAAAPANAATRAFTPIYTTNTTGDVMIRGNGLETCPTGSVSAGGSATCANVQNGVTSGQNNNFAMGYVDTDSDSTTFDSSSATVAIPAGATVLYAGLSWSGTLSAGSAAGYPLLTGAAAPNASAKGTVSFKVPGSSTYTAVNSTVSPVDSTSSGYQGFVNETAAVQTAGAGVYTVANVQAGTGGNDYAGWALAVAYRDPTQPVRNLVIYNGFTNVANGATTSIPITGFTTPLTGPVVTRLGAVVYEGDRGNVGDTLTLGSNAISNSLNPVNDVENSSITDLGVALTDRTPAYANTLSIDIDRFDATGFLTNGQTTTSINLKTVGDGYYPAVVSLATNLYSPSLQATQTVKDLTSGIASSVKSGDVLAYSMAITNVGSDGATSSILTDAVPSGTTYVPGSLVVGGAPVTDASGDDTGNVAGGTVTARLGTGATAAVGGAVATSASTTVAFNVTVNPGDANGTVIANAAALGYKSATTGTAFIGSSNTVSSTVSMINVNPVLAFAAPPSGEVSATYTTTLTAAGGTGPYTWAVTAGALPTGLALGTTGVVSGTPSTVGFYTFTVSATDANAQVATQTTSIYVAPLPTLTYPTALQNGDTGAAYSYPLGVNPGTGPYVWSVSAGSLPAGLTLDPATGVVSGTPTAAVTNKAFTVRVVDAFGASATEATTLTVIAGPTLNFAAPPSGEVTVPYTDQLTYAGGAGPYIWTTTAGALPAGLTLDSASGLLSGTPTASGTSNFTVTVSDVNGATASQATAVTVIAAPAVTFTPPPGEVGVTYTAQPTASGGTSPYTWAVSSGTLPAGLAINTSTGAITGTPTAASAASVTVQATDAVGGTGTQAGTITIVAAPTLTGTLPDGQLTVPYSSGLTVTNGTGPFVWSISSGTLPAGLSINTSTGLITGTPTAAGSQTITVQATDAKNTSASRSGTISVTANPAVTFSPPNGEVGVAYSAQPTAAGGTSPYTWAVSAGTLPAGLVINATTGAITGTTTVVGAASVTVQATDKVGGIATLASTITIVAAPTLTGTPPAGELTVPYSSGFTVNAGIGPFVWSLSSGPLPAGLSFNTSTGAITGTPTATGSFPITVRVTDVNNLTTTRSKTITVAAGPAVTFTPGNGEVGAAYTAQPAASGGSSPYTWAVSVGTLPAGLSINTGTGAITGTPTALGAASVTVQATDSKGGSATQASTITIVATPTLTGTLAAGELTVPYSSGFMINDGIGPFAWSVIISSGTLPGGLTINTSTGLITGTPTDAGSFPVTVQVTDANNFTTTRTATLTVAVGPAVAFTPGNGEVGVAYTAQPAAAGGTSPYTWAVSAGTLPTGLSIDPTTGAITGTPSAASAVSVTVQATDAVGAVATQAGTFTIVAAPTLSGTLAGGEATVPYSSGFTVNDGTGPFVWRVSSGPLPAGLSINTATGVITGTATTAGSYPITVQVTDANNITTTRTNTIAVLAGPAVTFTAPNGEVGVAYIAQPTAAGGTSPYTWVLSAGTLPAGLSIDTGTGVITGTPTTAGTATVTVQATDANGGTAALARTITIVARPTLTGTLPSGEVSAPYSSGYTLSGGIGPFVWSFVGSSPPAGLTFNTSTGVISGTPTTAGATGIRMRVVDANGQSAVTLPRGLTISAGPTVVFAPPSGEAGVAYTAQPTASGGASPYTWAVSTGTLPTGLSINTTTGAITGTPGAASTTAITVQATDSNGGTATQDGTITVVAAPALTFTAPPAAELGAAYSDQLTKSGGVGPFTWTVSVGSLPAGLTLASDTGLLSGTPTALGTSDFSVRIVDHNNKADTKTATIVVNKTTSTVSVSAPASVRFGNTVNVTAAVGPSAAGGTVTFTDVPTTGPQAGNTVGLGTGTVSGGAAGLTTTLPAFGVNTVTASYGGDTNHAPATSTATQVEVSAYAGEVIVTEFRTSGPGGAGDNYVELLNTGPTVPLAGIKVSSDSGAVSTLPANAGLLGTGRSYLLTGAGFSLAAVATSDFAVATVGTGGMNVTAPDTAGTRTDAVGPATGFHTGTGLAAITGNPDSQWAWVRNELLGAAVDSRDNAADFQLVSDSLALVGGVQPTLGSASPTGTADPYQHDATLQSTLLDTGKGQAIAPNRVVVTGTPGKLVIRRTITNTTGQTVTAAKVRVSALSEQFGAAEPGVSSQPGTVAQLRAINATGTTEPVTVTGGASVTVQDLSVDAPNASGLGGGLNSTFTVPLPGGGLAPGASVNVAFTFTVLTHGTFWFGYDVDATTAVAPANRTANRSATRTATHTDGRSNARPITTRHTAARVAGYVR